MPGRPEAPVPPGSVIPRLEGHGRPTRIDRARRGNSAWHLNTEHVAGESGATRPCCQPGEGPLVTGVAPEDHQKTVAWVRVPVCNKVDGAINVLEGSLTAPGSKRPATSAGCIRSDSNSTGLRMRKSAEKVTFPDRHAGNQ